MKEDFAIAKYALERAIEFAIDADMKGPCNCEEYMQHICEALDHLRAARTALAYWREKE